MKFLTIKMLQILLEGNHIYTLLNYLIILSNIICNNIDEYHTPFALRKNNALLAFRISYISSLTAYITVTEDFIDFIINVLDIHRHCITVGKNRFLVNTA